MLCRQCVIVPLVLEFVVLVSFARHMNQEKWRQTYVCLPDQSVLSVYHFYSQGSGISDDREHGEDVHNEVVLLIAGCGKSI